MLPSRLSSNSEKYKKFESLDGFRGSLALSVLVHHAMLWLNKYDIYPFFVTLGNYYGELNIEYYTNYDKGVNTPNVNLVNIQNARLINTTETGEDKNDTSKPIRFITEKYKKITGGDPIVTRKLFSNTEIKFVAGKSLIQTNLMPELVGIEKKENYSLRERVEILDFPFYFCQ